MKGSSTFNTMNVIIKTFSRRKYVKEHMGKDPLKCEKCEGEMLLYKVVYRIKMGT